MASYRLTFSIKIFIAAVMMTASMINMTHALEILRGKAVQGGMLVLKTAPNHRVTANDDPVMVSDNGYVVIGFHRDDTAPVTLKAFNGDMLSNTLTVTPAPRVYDEQRIDGLPTRMVTPPEDVLARIKKDRAVVSAARAHATPVSAFKDEFDWPVQGIITGVYGVRRILNGEPRAPHFGIDIAAPKGTAVMAPQAGIIRMVKDLYYTGWTIILDHGHGVSSTFLHLEDISVSVGTSVQKGHMIGTVGSTGRSTGPHLDWRVNWFNKRLDPSLLVGPMPSN